MLFNSTHSARRTEEISVCSINRSVVHRVGDGVLRTGRSASRVQPTAEGAVAVQGRAGGDTSEYGGPDQSGGTWQ